MTTPNRNQCGSLTMRVQGDRSTHEEATSSEFFRETNAPYEARNGRNSQIRWQWRTRFLLQSNSKRLFSVPVRHWLLLWNPRLRTVVVRSRLWPPDVQVVVHRGFWSVMSQYGTRRGARRIRASGALFCSFDPNCTNYKLVCGIMGSNISVQLTQIGPIG